jgi:hypothetical protein
VKSVSLYDDKSTLRKIIGSSIMGQLLSKEIKYIKAEGLFIIKNYNVGIDCDNSWSRGELVEFEILQPLKYKGLGVHHGC